MKKIILYLTLCFYSAVLLSQNTELQYIDIVKMNDKSIFQGKILSIDEKVVVMENVRGFKFDIIRKDIKTIKQACLNCKSMNDKIAEEWDNLYETKIGEDGSVKFVLKDATRYFTGFYHQLSAGIISSEKTLPGGGVTWQSGYFIRPRIGLSLGTGVQSYSDYTNTSNGNFKSIIVTPLFIEAKTYLKKSMRVPFIALAGGYGKPQFDDYAKGGFYFSPSIGTQFSSDKGTNFMLSLGFLSQKITYDYGASNFDYQIIRRDLTIRRWTVQMGMVF
jgi:hypothetical protein